MEQIKPMYNWSHIISAYWKYRALYCKVNRHFAVELRKDEQGWPLHVYEEIEDGQYIRYGTMQPEVDSPLDRPIATRVILKMQREEIPNIKHTYEIKNLRIYPPKIQSDEKL